MAIDAGTAALVGVGLTVTATLMGVAANLRVGREQADVNRGQLERQVKADNDVEQDRAFVRLEKENDRLNESLAAERAAHEATRQELLVARNDNAMLRAENLTLTAGLVQPAPPSRPPAKRTPRKGTPSR